MAVMPRGNGATEAVKNLKQGPSADAQKHKLTHAPNKDLI